MATMPEVLPPLYQRWIDALLPEGIPSETRSTCSSCAMLPKAGENADDRTFNPTTKCCTYLPDLHNFIAGNILADDAPENYTARRTLERRIAARVAVTPLSIAPPPLYSVIYSNSALVGPAVFGHSASLKCPLYIEHTGQCGIWRHREAVCATFFCKYERGTFGRRFWEALSSFLGQLEYILRVWALDQIDPTTSLSNASLGAELNKPKKSIDAEGLANVIHPAKYERLWGPFVGREVEIYRSCADLVNRLDFSRVLEIAGGLMATAARSVREMHRRLIADGLPGRVAIGDGHQVQIGRAPGKARLKNSLALYDHIDVPVEALAAATRLVGRPLAQAREQLRAEGLDVDDRTVRSLIDYEVLVPA